MGAQAFVEYYSARSAKEAYNIAVSEAIHEYGHGSYSGTIKEKSGYIELKKPKGVSIEKFIDEKIQENDKWGEAYVVCVKEGTTTVTETVPYGAKVNNYPAEGTRKWVTKYVVYTANLNELKSFEKKADAVKFARSYSENNKANLQIHLEKRIVNGSNIVADIEPRTKEVKKKVPMNEYVLFGLASS